MSPPTASQGVVVGTIRHLFQFDPPALLSAYPFTGADILEKGTPWPFSLMERILYKGERSGVTDNFIRSLSAGPSGGTVVVLTAC
jgi:hypothetical protein